MENRIARTAATLRRVLTEAGKGGCFLNPRRRWHQPDKDDSRSSIPRITTGMSFSSQCKHVDDDQRSAKCTSIAQHGDGSATDPREHIKAVDGCNSLMICNLPCSLLCEQLAAVVDSKGFEGKYDSLHLPGNRKHSSNVGYGFISFHKQEHAMEFAKTFRGYRFAGNSNKHIQIKPARIQRQRRASTPKRYRTSRNMRFANRQIMSQPTTATELAFQPT